MWQEGSIRVHESVFHYWIKVYSEGSRFGIDGGKISKLTLKRDGKVVANYDRGWDIKPVDQSTEFAVEILLHSNNY